MKQVHALAHLFKFIIYYNNIYIRKEMPIQFNLIYDIPHSPPSQPGSIRPSVRPILDNILILFIPFQISITGSFGPIYIYIIFFSLVRRVSEKKSNWMPKRKQSFENLNVNCPALDGVITPQTQTQPQ